MKGKLKLIVVTFLATTVFWCLTIAGFFWLLPQNSGVDLVEDARQRGFIAILRASNTESHSVTFRVEELQTSKPTVETPPVVLLERQLPPSGEFLVGIKKAESK